MAVLLPDDVATKEVLAWKGLHLFHAHMSSCSQKIRIYLNLKGLAWASHPVDLLANEHLTPRFLGINPRGVVPVLIDDGHVHIESNDILLHLEKRFPEPRLVPSAEHGHVACYLEEENSLHFDLRTLSFRFLFQPDRPPKSAQDLERYAINGTGLVQGRRDGAIDREISYWRKYLEDGIDDESARRSANAFRRSLDKINDALAAKEYINGESMSLLDVAWLVSVQRLVYAGYPLEKLHPRIDAWRSRLMAQPSIHEELKLPPALEKRLTSKRLGAEGLKQSLAAICFPGLS